MTAGLDRGRKLLPGLKVAEGFTRHPFDQKFDAHTSGLVPGRHLKSGHPHDRHATAYYGVAPSVLNALVRRWQRSRPATPLEDFSFIDFGAGMGRAVLVAAQRPFRQVIGVELNPILVRTAKRNLAVWRSAGRARSPMKVIHQDAAEFALPAGPCLAFLFNPFGATVMRQLVKAWKKAQAGRAEAIDILYVNNEQEHVLESELSRRMAVERLFLGQIGRSRADAIADHRILANQPEGEYASANFEDCSIWRWRGELRTKGFS